MLYFKIMGVVIAIFIGTGLGVSILIFLVGLGDMLQDKIRKWLGLF